MLRGQQGDVQPLLELWGDFRGFRGACPHCKNLSGWASQGNFYGAHPGGDMIENVAQEFGSCAGLLLPKCSYPAVENSSLVAESHLRLSSGGWGPFSGCDSQSQTWSC